MKHTTLFAVLLLLPVVAFADVGESVHFGNTDAISFSRAVKPAGNDAVVFETTDSSIPSSPYDTVVLHGVMPDAHLALQVYSTPDAKWYPMETRRFDDGRFWAKFQFGYIGSAPVRLRAVDSGLAKNNTLEVYNVEVFLSTSRQMEDNGKNDITITADDEAKAVPYVTLDIPLVRRAEWGAKPPTEAYTPQNSLYRITVHHTEGRQTMTMADAKKEMTFIQDYHQNTRKWIDVGYHFLIDGLGNVYEGRPYNVYGAHVESNNTGNVGISIMGSYQAPKDNHITPATLASLEKLIRELMGKQAISARNLYAHREINATDCPGNNLYPVFTELRTKLQSEASASSVAEPAAVPQAERFNRDYLDNMSQRIGRVISGW